MKFDVVISAWNEWQMSLSAADHSRCTVEEIEPQATNDLSRMKIPLFHEVQRNLQV